MKLEQFVKGDVIYRTKPKMYKSFSMQMFGGLEEREDRSFMNEPYIFSEVRGNLCAFIDAKDDYFHKLEMDKYNDDAWDYYPVFAQEVGKYHKLMIGEDGRYYAKDCLIEAPLAHRTKDI